MSAPKDAPLDFDTVVVDAGISGIGTAIQLRRERSGSYVRAEKADDLGGWWRGLRVRLGALSAFRFEPAGARSS